MEEYVGTVQFKNIIRFRQGNTIFQLDRSTLIFPNVGRIIPKGKYVYTKKKGRIFPKKKDRS